jgi:hypothetical protein
VLWLNACFFDLNKPTKMATKPPHFCKYMCSGQCEFMAFLMVFNLWIGPGFIFEPCS